MLAILVITALIQVQIPGASSITPITNERVSAGLLSDDGSTGYFFDSGINRYPLMARGGPSGGELLISRRENGKPHTRTTSQDSHFEYRPGTVGLLRVGTTRTLCSPGDETVLNNNAAAGRLTATFGRSPCGAG